MKPRKPSKPHQSQPAPGRYFHLTYSSAGPDDVHKLFQGRDGAAFNELAATLPPLGYPHLVTKPGFVMAELIFKQPIPDSPLTPEFAADPAFLEVNILTKSRPPLITGH